MTLEHGRDIADLYRRVNNLLRVGKVVAVDYAVARARVKIGNITTDFLPWMTPSTAAWIPLKNGEQVVVLSPGGDLRFGMILPALYQSAKSAPSDDAEEIAIVANITQVGNTKMTGNFSADKNIAAGGHIDSEGNITAQGEVEGNGVKLSPHTHDFQYVGAGQGATPQSATTKKPT